MGRLLRRRATVCLFVLSVARIHLIELSGSIGDSAKNTFHSNPQNTVFDAKRLIGRNFDDPEVQKDMKHWHVLL